jgi:hypothetical protein
MKVWEHRRGCQRFADDAPVKKSHKAAEWFARRILGPWRDEPLIVCVEDDNGGVTQYVVADIKVEFVVRKVKQST